MRSPAKSVIAIPIERWTPVRHEILDELLAKLEQKRAAFLYLFFYDRAWHRDSRKVSATMAQLSRGTGMDERTLAKCVEELERKKLIKRVREGVQHSHINKPRWRVPLSEFWLNDGNWTPVPRFLITRYCKAFPNAVLLVYLLRYQHMKWLNKSWVGVTTLCKRTGWSPTRVRRALHIMAHKHSWEKQGIRLPQPLELGYHHHHERRHFRVRAVWYERVTKNERTVTRMKVPKEFRDRFKISTQYGDKATAA